MRSKISFKTDSPVIVAVLPPSWLLRIGGWFTSAPGAPVPSSPPEEDRRPRGPSSLAGKGTVRGRTDVLRVLLVRPIWIVLSRIWRVRGVAPRNRYAGQGRLPAICGGIRSKPLSGLQRLSNWLAVRRRTGNDRCRGNGNAAYPIQRPGLRRRRCRSAAPRRELRAVRALRSFGQRSDLRHQAWRSSPPGLSGAIRARLAYRRRRAGLIAAGVLLFTPGLASAAAPSLHRCAHAPHEGRLSVTVDPGPGCDGAAVLARRLWRAAERRFPRPLPRHYTVDTPSPPADAPSATFRFRCIATSAIVQSRQAGHEVRVTTARCANQRGSRFRYSFTMA